VDQDVILSVCSTLLAAHGVDLRKVGPDGGGTEILGFELATQLSPRQDAVPALDT